MTDPTPLRHPDTIAPGDWLLVYAQVTAIDCDHHCACIDSAPGALWYAYRNFFSVPAELENGIKNSENAPAHDKTRHFRAGDIVQPCQRDGRAPWGYTGTSRHRLNFRWTLTVLLDEGRGMVKCQTGSGFVFETSPFFLKLVTPVEESEPYHISETETHWQVEFVNGEVVATYSKAQHPTPHGAALATARDLNKKHKLSHD